MILGMGFASWNGVMFELSRLQVELYITHTQIETSLYETIFFS